MATDSSELRETWEYVGGKMVAAGDTDVINDLLATKLEKLRAKNWRVLYRHRETGQFWELTYPQTEMHGGGPRLLRRLNITEPSQWTNT